MPDEFVDLRRDITTFLSSLKHSLENANRALMAMPSGRREQHVRLLLMIEEARIRFLSRMRYSGDNYQEWSGARTELLDFLSLFSQSKDFDREVRGYRFRVYPAGMNRPNSRFLDSLREGGYTIEDALFAVRELIKGSVVDAPTDRGLLFSDLLKIVPEQQLAPVRFEVREDKIFVVHERSHGEEEDRRNISSALDHILDAGQRLIENLQMSNCDRRMVDVVKDLHNQISSQQSIVKVGLTNISCGMMCVQFQGELPDALSALLNSYHASVSMYVAQFPEWEHFSQKAASLEFGEDDIREIDSTAADIIEMLEGNLQLADPEVPKTIRFVRRFISNPSTTIKRAAFALLSTLENLASAILRYSAEVLDDARIKFKDHMSSMIAATAVGLLSVALVATTGIGSAAMHVGSPWVKQASEIVHKKIKSIKN